MGVFSPDLMKDMGTVLAAYGLSDDIISCQGMTEGVENSTFLVTTRSDQYIVSLIERRVDRARLLQAAKMMRAARIAGIVCPRLLEARTGDPFIQSDGRVWCVQTYLTGLPMTCPSLDQVRCAGETLAKIHLACRNVPEVTQNPVGRVQWPGLLEALEMITPRAEHILPEMRADIRALPHDWPTQLPAGPIHGDYFISNILRSEDIIQVFDFFLCCTDLLAYDLALALTDWAFDDQNGWSHLRHTSFLDGYDGIRPVSSEERQALPYLCRLGAIRIVLTRALDVFRAQRAGAVEAKAPGPFVARYEQLRAAL